MLIDLSPAAGLIERRSWPEVRKLALAALAETPRRSEALRLLAAVSESEGRLDDADRYLSDAANAAPGDVGAIDELIRVSHLRGDLRRLGEALLARLRISPESATLWNDLGVVHERFADPRQAAACYRRAVSADPASAPALANGSALAYRLNQFQEALQLARRALVAGAGTGQMLVVVGHAQQRLGDAGGATGSYRRALALAPNEISAWEGLAAVRRLAKMDDEVLCYVRRTVALAPFSPVALGNLCEALRAIDEPDRASGFGRRALVLAPGLVAAATALSVALGQLSEDRLSTVWAQRALQIDPADGALMINLGIALKGQGLFREAKRYLHAGLGRRPDDANGHMAMATARLASGEMREGLAEYEWRHAPGFYEALPVPRWDGSAIPDGALLVRGEQGVGEEIMFIQYIRDLRGKVGRIVVECDKRLLSIFRRSFPEAEFVGRSTPAAGRLSEPDIVAQIALLSLPHVLGLGVGELRSKGAFLAPDLGRRAAMEARLDALGRGPRVGISWRSRRRTRLSLRMHTELADWAPILNTPGVTFVNLQYGDVGVELDQVRRRFGVDITNLRDLDLFDDLEGGLALGSCLDLVISTVTTAHCLAAAAGIETWHLHPVVDHLGFGAERYVFCPRSRSFQRRAGESWARPIDDVADALGRRAGSVPGRGG